MASVSPSYSGEVLNSSRDRKTSALRASSIRDGILLVSVSNSAALYSPRQFRRVSADSPMTHLPKLTSTRGQLKSVTRDTICDLARLLIPTNRRPALRPCQENWQTEFVVIPRPVALGVVHRCDIHLARAQLGIRNRHHGITPFVDRRHQSGLAFFQGIHGHTCERESNHTVDRVGAA